MTHPGILAVFDQARAEFGAEIDILVEVYNGLAAKNGEGQAVADLTVWFRDSDRFNEAIVRALLATAVQTVAEIRAADRTQS